MILAASGDDALDESLQLIDALKRMLKMRGVTYQSLGRSIGLSEASVKRIFARGTFTLKRLEQICRTLDLSVADLVRTIEHKDYRASSLSLAQEAALAKDEVLLSYFYLLLNGWSNAEILRHYEFDEPQLRRLSVRLVELGLLEALPRQRHRLRVGRQIMWRKDGPVRRSYERRVQQEFLRSPFSGSREYLAWQPVELTDASIGVLRRKFAQLYRDFLEMAELDLRSRQPRHSTALLLAFRPWVFSLVAARQRRSRRHEMLKG